jgi:hypothetical protein
MPDPKIKHLHLKAESADDLSVISSAVQDSILRIEGIIYNPKKRSLMLGLQRFRHESECASRITSGLRFDSVLSVKSTGIDISKKDAFLVLLSVKFEELDMPAGRLTLNFAGNGVMIADAECLDALLFDRGEPWKTQSVPKHSD